MGEKIITPSERGEEQTKQFLSTNGPPAGCFAPDPSLESLLEGKSELEKRFYRSQSTQGKQNDYIISQVTGLKVVQRSVMTRLQDGDEQFKTIHEALAPFIALRQRWVSRRNFVWHIVVVFFTTVVLAGLGIYLGDFLLEWTKRYLGWH